MLYFLHMNYIYLFVVTGILGWVIDSGYRSLLERKLISGGFLPIPFSPIYAFGALLIVLIHFFIQDFHIISRGIIYGAVLTFYEFISGFFILKIIGYRLWDYSENTLNILGHTDILHACYWIILALLFEYILKFF